MPRSLQIAWLGKEFVLPATELSLSVSLFKSVWRIAKLSLKHYGVTRRRTQDPQQGLPSENTRKHVVVLSQFYKPEPLIYPPAVAILLRDAGYRVSVITGFPNRPGGQIYPEYRQRFNFSEVIDGIRVHRVPLVINHSRKALERIANFISFGISALSATKVVQDADAIYVYATPATAAIPAQVWHRLFKIPYVLHVQDLWPDSVTASGMMGQGQVTKIAEAAMKPWIRGLYGKAASLIAISPGMRQLLIDRGFDGSVTSVVYNWAHEASNTVKASASFSNDGLRLLYAGNLGALQDLETVIAAAKQFERHREFSLDFAGEGVLEDILKEKASESSNIRFLGMLPRSEISRLYINADFQLVTLKDMPIFRTTVPSKLQASLASGVPVITTVGGDVAGLVERYNAGMVAKPENVESLAAAFRAALDMSASERARMGANARRLYEEHMSQEAGGRAIQSIFEDITGRVSETVPRKK